MKATKATEKKLMSECNEFFVLNDGSENKSDKYVIELPKTNFLIIEVGAMVGKPVATFTHPNIIKSVKRIYEFKHYRKNGGKYWTSKAGISHYFIVPTSEIVLLPEEGYSYVKAEINGVKVSFNVSGGGGGEGWSDWLTTSTAISVNHKLAEVKKIAEVAMRNVDIESQFKIADIEESDEQRWKEMSDKQNPKFIKQKKELLGQIKYVHEPIKIITNRVAEFDEAIADGLNYKGEVLVRHDGNLYRLRNSQIDWIKTCKENMSDKEIKVIVQ